MASFEKAITNNLIETFLPSFGTPKKKIPVWDSGQKMFILNNYESAAGHYYYEGMRFCEHIVIKEKVGKYHLWTYLDSLEVYAFNGVKLELVQKRDYEKAHRQSVDIPKESEDMIYNYLAGSIKLQGGSLNEEQLRTESHRLVEGCFKDFLDDDYNPRLMKILPLLEAH